MRLRNLALIALPLIAAGRAILRHKGASKPGAEKPGDLAPTPSGDTDSSAAIRAPASGSNGVSASQHSPLG